MRRIGEVSVFSLKGWNNLAQGNALGMWTKDHMHPERVRLPESAGDLLSQPYRLDDHSVMKPRALPWAVMCQPFRLKS
jgi:hypothetical protein